MTTVADLINDVKKIGGEHTFRRLATALEATGPVLIGYEICSGKIGPGSACEVSFQMVPDYENFAVCGHNSGFRATAMEDFAFPSEQVLAVLYELPLASETPVPEPPLM